jgi:hypothetical protein
MCDITPVRNALLLLAGPIALAASSATFGLGFLHAPPFLAWLLYLGLWAAIAWCVAGAFLLLSAINALNIFCSCASAIAACSSACAQLRALLAVIATFFVVLLAASVAMIIDKENVVAATIVIITAFLMTINIFLLLIFGLILGSCQPAKQK